MGISQKLKPNSVRRGDQPHTCILASVFFNVTLFGFVR